MSWLASSLRLRSLKTYRVGADLKVVIAEELLVPIDSSHSENDNLVGVSVDSIVARRC